MYCEVNCGTTEMGKRIIERMEQRNVNMSEIARCCDVDRKTIGRLIHDDINIRMVTAIRVADFLGMSLDYMVWGK